MTEPNPRQQKLITSHDGLYQVDAGPGTGKTFTITRRYVDILTSNPIDTEDILLVTFTNNAAREMKDRIGTHGDVSQAALQDAPIQTFHSRCWDLLTDHGQTTPSYLGIDDRITDSTQLIDAEPIEGERFREFWDTFVETHQEHEPLAALIDSPHSLLSLLHTLAARGIVPTSSGWFRDGRDRLRGDYEQFESVFSARNQPQNGGDKQSKLRAGLVNYGRDHRYRSNAPSRAEIRGDGKAVPSSLAQRVFEEDRKALFEFVHDVYYEYIEFALARNYLNFSFLQAMAFVLLCQDDHLRNQEAFEYVMVDEFQDTSEIQFKLILLMTKENNLCVVGDWKQSIYGFQDADVENIRSFEERLRRFKDALNSDSQRIDLEPTPVTKIHLVQNYRSTQAIIDLADDALTVPATGGETVDTDEVDAFLGTQEPVNNHEKTQIVARQHEDEHELVCSMIEEIVDNPTYEIIEDGEPRRPRYGDIAVLTRTRSFGRELLEVGRSTPVPMAYDGGIELFRTDQAKLVLAWFRILERDADRGWALVYERAGFTMGEIEHRLEKGSPTPEMVQFREQLNSYKKIESIIRAICQRYGYDDAVTDVLIDELASLYQATDATRGELIRFIERGIEDGWTQEVSAPTDTDSVSVRTIHASKGLEHPIVLMANMNQYQFPSSGGGGQSILFEDPLGLRQRHEIASDHGRPYRYYNWKVDVARQALPKNYDEERRLLYVAITRAQHHVLFSAGEKPNTFLESLPVDIEAGDFEPVGGSKDRHEQQALQLTVPTPEGPKSTTPHAIMEDIDLDREAGRGTALGQAVHDFAEAYVEDKSATPETADERAIVDFLDSFDGTLKAEVDMMLPLDVDGESITIIGIADLLVTTPSSVRVVDFKTDVDRGLEPAYRTQVSVYYHTLKQVYPERTISGTIFYTHLNEAISIQPESIETIKRRVAESMSS